MWEVTVARDVYAENAPSDFPFSKVTHDSSVPSTRCMLHKHSYRMIKVLKTSGLPLLPTVEWDIQITPPRRRILVHQGTPPEKWWALQPPHCPAALEPRASSSVTREFKHQQSRIRKAPSRDITADIQPWTCPWHGVALGYPNRLESCPPSDRG